MKKYFLFALLFLTYSLTTCKSQTPPSRGEVLRSVQNYRQSVQSAADTFLNSKFSDAVRLAAIAPHGLVFDTAQAARFKAIVADTKASVPIRAAALDRLHNHIPSDRALENLTFDFLRNPQSDNRLRLSAFGALKALSFSQFTTIDARASVTDVLRKMTDAPEKDFRQYAFQSLVAQNDDAARARLIEGIRVPEKAPLSVAESLNALSFDSKPANFQPIAFEVFQKNDNTTARLTAIQMLGAYAPAKGPLSILLNNPKANTAERRAALGVLYAGNRKEIVPLTTALLLNDGDTDENLKATAVQMAMYYRQSIEGRKEKAADFDRLINRISNRPDLLDNSVLKKAALQYINVIKPKF